MRPDKNHEATLIQLLPQLDRLSRILAPSPDRAEDLAQEALLQVWSRLQKGTDINDLRPYLMTVLRHSSRKAPEAGGIKTVALTEQNAGSQPPAQTARLAWQDVQCAIDRLPADQAALLRVLYLRGASYQELAQQFDLPIGTVMSRLARARARLRKELDLPAGHAVAALLDTGKDSLSAPTALPV